MLPDIKLIILTNINAKLFGWMLTSRKVVWQQIRGEVLILIQASSADPFGT